MAKLTGALLLLGSGLWLGLGRSRTMARRVRDLESWAFALSLWEGELAFRLPALPELFRVLSRRCPSPAREVLQAAGEGMDELGERPFRDIWRGAVSAHPGALAPDEVQALCRLGEALGQCGWEDQRRAVEETGRALLRSRDQVREDLRREGRAYGALGLALGAFLTILLL